MKKLNSNHLKLLAIIAMTIVHIAEYMVIFQYYLVR